MRFTWDEEEESHARAFLDEGEDEALDAVLLGDQRVDAFGDWFLPPPENAEVAPGDRWELTKERWNDFLRMGGEFWVDAADADAPDEEHAAHVRDFEGQLLRNGESDLACWLAAVEAEDGERVAVIGFEGTLDSHAKQDYTSDFDGTRGEVSARVEHEMRIEGSCRFDLDAGRALSIETRITITTTITERTTQEGTGPRVQGTDFVTVEDTVTEVAVTFEAGRLIAGAPGRRIRGMACSETKWRSAARRGAAGMVLAGLWPSRGPRRRPRPRSPRASTSAPGGAHPAWPSCAPSTRIARWRSSAKRSSPSGTWWCTSDAGTSRRTPRRSTPTRPPRSSSACGSRRRSRRSSTSA